MLGCGPDRDIWGRSTHELRENSAVEVFCKAAVLLHRSLLDLQLTLVWGGQQERLKERKPDLQKLPKTSEPICNLFLSS